jgi:hypothetical protein
VLAGELAMKRSIAAVCIGVLVASAGARAQTSKSSAKENNTPSTLTGCVSDRALPNGEFTFTDGTTGSKFRLTGKGIRQWAGQQVEIVSGPNKRLSVKGGLYPSPNIAAQAGAIDPAQAAIARQPGGTASGTGGVDLPEFRVARVRAAGGSCR